MPQGMRLNTDGGGHGSPNHIRTSSTIAPPSDRGLTSYSAYVDTVQPPFRLNTTTMGGLGLSAAIQVRTTKRMRKRTPH